MIQAPKPPACITSTTMPAHVNHMMGTLFQLLPPTSSPPQPTTLLKDMVMLPNMGGEPSVLIIKHEELDPYLIKWLGTVQKRYGAIANDAVRAERVFRHVRRTFWSSRHSILNPVAGLRYRAWRKVDAIRLGAFLAKGIGNCLPQGAALQLAFQAVNISSELVIGEYEEIALDEKIYGEVVGQELHAWVEAELGVDRTLLDPNQNRISTFGNRTQESKRRFTGSSFLVGETAISYEPIKKSMIIGVQNLLSQEDVEVCPEMFQQAFLVG